MDYLTLKPGSMDYLVAAAAAKTQPPPPAGLDYFSAYATMLDRTRLYFQSLPQQVRPYEGRVATAADLGPLLSGRERGEIPLDLSIKTIRQTPDSTAVDDDVIVLEHKKAAARHALSKLQAARLGEAFLPPVGATFPHPNSANNAASANNATGKKACHPHNGLMLASPLGSFSSSCGGQMTSTEAVAASLNHHHHMTHLNLLGGSEFIPTSLQQQQMHRAQALQSMAALGGAAGGNASGFERGVPKLIPLCQNSNQEAVSLAELYRLGNNFLLPPSCAVGMALSKQQQQQLVERYVGTTHHHHPHHPMGPPPPGFPKENACPCCPPTGLPIPCACCVPTAKQAAAAASRGAFTAYTEACCPPKEQQQLNFAAMSALYNGAFPTSSSTSTSSTSSKDAKSINNKEARSLNSNVPTTKHHMSSSTSSSTTQTSGSKGSSSSMSNAKDAVNSVSSREASTTSSTLTNVKSSMTTLTSSTYVAATPLIPANSNNHHIHQSSSPDTSREGCARTDGRDKRSMLNKELARINSHANNTNTSNSTSHESYSPAYTKTNRIYAPLASIPTIPGEQTNTHSYTHKEHHHHHHHHNHNHHQQQPQPLLQQQPVLEVASSLTAKMVIPDVPKPDVSKPSDLPEPTTAVSLEANPAIMYPHPHGLPAKESYSPAKAEEAVRKHLVTVWRPGNWDDEPPKYPSPSPKEAVVPSSVLDKAAPAPMSPRGASLPEVAEKMPEADTMMLMTESASPAEQHQRVPEECLQSAEFQAAFLPPERKMSVVEELVQKYRKKYVENRMLQRLLVNIKRPKPPTCSGAVLPYLIADKKNAGKRRAPDADSTTVTNSNNHKRFRIAEKDRHQQVNAGSSVHDKSLPTTQDTIQTTVLYPVKERLSDSDDHNKRSKSKRTDGIWRKRHERIQKIIIKMRANNTATANIIDNTNSPQLADISSTKQDAKLVHPSLDNALHKGIVEPLHRPTADLQDKKEHYESNAVLDNTEKLIVRLYYGRKRFGFGGHRRRHCRSGFDYIRPKKKSVKKYAYEAHPPKHVETLVADPTEYKDECQATEGANPLDTQLKLVSPNQVRTPNCIPQEMKRLMINKTLGETVLHRAARQGYSEVVLYCLETKYVEIDAKDNAGYTPLHECCARGHLQIARYLLQFGADVNASAAGGIRPIHDAVENDHVEVVRLLLSYGADPLLATYSGLTPVKIAHSLTMQQLLTGFLADVAGESDPNVTPWQFFGSSRCFDSLETGFDVFDDLPSDIEEVEDHNEITFEISDRPHIQTYLINHPSYHHGPETYCLLEDVLRQTGQSNDQFLHYHINAQIISLPRMEFVQLIESSQMVGESSSLFATDMMCAGDSAGGSPINMVRLDDMVRHMLGVETVIISTHE